MTTERELRAAVDALGESVAAFGCGTAGRAAVERLETTAGESANGQTERGESQRLVVAAAEGRESGTGRTRDDDRTVEGAGGAGVVDEEAMEDRDAVGDRDVEADHRAAMERAASVLVAVELGEATGQATALVGRANDRGAMGVVLAVVPDGGPGRTAWRALNRLREAADAVLLVPALVEGESDRADEREPERTEERPPSSATRGLLAALQLLLGLVETVGVVNLDLADVHTVLSSGDLALLARGHADDRADARTMVERTVGRAPRGFGLNGAPTVLVHIRCGPGLSVTTAGAVVDAVRDEVARDAHVIWGATIDESLADQALGVELVVGRVAPVAEAGHPCPRCGATIVEYTFGEHSTVACDECGYAGVTTALR